MVFSEIFPCDKSIYFIHAKPNSIVLFGLKIVMSEVIMRRVLK